MSGSNSLPGRSAIVGVSGLIAASAIPSGAAMLSVRHGHPYLPLHLLHNTPFDSFLIPGLLLLFVIGGSALACMIFASRRSPAAIDATIFAGGALAMWIAVETALMRVLSPLQLIYGGLGIALLALGVRAGLRSKAQRHRWTILVTGAEALGYLAPATVGIASSAAGASAAAQTLLVSIAGLFEGLAVGAGQAIAFPAQLRRTRYALLTSVGAGVVWAIVMTTRLLVVEHPGRLSAALVPIAASVALVAIGAVQWLELRRRVPAAHRWIPWTAAAWAVALPLSFTPGPFVDEHTPLAAQLVLRGCAGALMAYAMALVTWQGVRSVGARDVAPSGREGKETSMRVLVTWGSKRGGTEGIARMVGEGLRARGLEVTLAPAKAAGEVGEFDAVIVGGALYGNRWHPAARRFVRRHVAELRRVPVWFFSSGPLDRSADEKDLPPPTQIAAMAQLVGSKGHVTFGGRLAPDAKGLVASAVAKRQSGDFRNPDRIRAWAMALADQLPSAVPGPHVDPPARAWSQWIGYALVGWALCSLVWVVLGGFANRRAAMGVHLVAAPLIFGVLAKSYFARPGAREPLPSAFAWTGLVAVLDLAVVSAAVQRSTWMFRHPWATWIPYALILLTVWGVGAISSTLPWPKVEPKLEKGARA